MAKTIKAHSKYLTWKGKEYYIHQETENYYLVSGNPDFRKLFSVRKDDKLLKIKS